MLYVYITHLIRHLKGELKKVIDQATQETSRRGWGWRAQRDRTKFGVSGQTEFCRFGLNGKIRLKLFSGLHAKHGCQWCYTRSWGWCMDDELKQFFCRASPHPPPYQFSSGGIYWETREFPLSPSLLVVQNSSEGRRVVSYPTPPLSISPLATY